ncbi:membrane protein [Arthrobacter phage Nellie]|uniref:Membrane protein n=4 Tax=Jasminevirus adat TaxID=2560299 RepID=A0A249XN76_9CAUD|nr:hypothetical protein FDI47_gp32 [Arthrobacter phage Adat]ASZ72604.1 membrane protein [Arthrobacter phage Adat]ASZ73186.1 membrane protein [Arthrobacter phage GurgleFerb]ASZ73750.1 membrane protein [Arthrobacter phage Nellie]AXH43720.1 membrane protein [Arthrobacter phage Brad]
MEEFEAAWNVVGIVCSWVVAGILLALLVMAVIFIRDEL